MKFTHLVFLSFLMLSCSDTGDQTSYENRSFSINKFSEDLTSKFFTEEMNVITDSLSLLSDKARECSLGDASVDIFEYRDLWKVAMLSFHKVHPFLNSGVLTADVSEQNTLIDGLYEGYLDAVPCKIQNKIMDSSELSEPNVQGFGALEYALYAPSLELNSCPSNASFRDQISMWINNTTEEEKIRSLCAYVEKASLDLVQKADSFKSYVGEFSDDELVQSLYTSTPLQKIFDSLSLFMKDNYTIAKIEQPLNLEFNYCFKGTSCADKAENIESEASYEALQSNLEGFLKIFKGTGESEDGLSQFLRINGHGILVDQVYHLVDQSLALLEQLNSLDESFFEAASRLNTQDKENCLNSSLNNPIEPLCVFRNLSIELNEMIQIDLKAALAVSETVVEDGDGD